MMRGESLPNLHTLKCKHTHKVIECNLALKNLCFSSVTWQKIQNSVQTFNQSPSLTLKANTHKYDITARKVVIYWYDVLKPFYSLTCSHTLFNANHERRLLYRYRNRDYVCQFVCASLKCTVCVGILTFCVTKTDKCNCSEQPNHPPSSIHPPTPSSSIAASWPVLGTRSSSGPT